ncbi:MAG TPA: agmatinase [Dehalococcoidia bacterium]|nr:agmatinase [Dehalococcoidia bacterium]
MTFIRPEDERFWPPHAFGGVPHPYAEYADARVVILPVPYDSTVSARSGAKDGPAAIIANSMDMELYDAGIGFEPYLHGVYTSPAVFVTNASPEAMIDRVHEIAAEYLNAGKFLVTLGGEHTIAVGSFRAHRDRYPGLSVLAIDAHADLRDEYQDTRYNHACSLRRMLDDVPVSQVGLRSAAVEEAALIAERRLPFYSPKAFRAMGADLSQIVDGLSDHVYVTIDLDGLDSGEMPAVGTPEPGGLAWEEVSDLIRAVAAKKRIVGFDIMELAPDLGPKACAYAAAKLTYRMIGLALGPPEG